MNLGEIWWQTIPNAVRLYTELGQNLCGGTHVVMKHPAHLPWKETFWEKFEGYIHEHDSNRSLKRVAASDIGGEKDSLGEYLLKRCCKEELRCQFRPGIGYAKFLATRCERSTLKDTYLVIDGAKAEQIKNWLPFLSEYTSLLPDAGSGCACLILTEDSLEALPCKGIRQLEYDKFITEYDSLVFDLIASGEQQVGSNPLRQYLGELVIAVTGTDVELGAACISAGEAFMSSPRKVLKKLAETGSYSNGNPFPPPPEKEELQNRIWVTQLKLLMPKIELFRKSFLEHHKEEIQKHLPCKNSLQEWVNEYQQVELGLLWFFYTQKYFNIASSREEQNLKLYREARNSLAHIEALDYAMVKQIW